MSARTVVPDPRWDGLVGVYGGYVAALFADEASDPAFALRSLTIRFTAGVESAPFEMATSWLHRGRRTATARMTLTQRGRLRAEATAGLFRREAEADAATHVHRSDASGTEPPSGYLARPHAQGDLAFVRNLDVRTPLPAGIEHGNRAWLRLGRPRHELGLQSGAAAVCVLLDALLPVLFAGDDPPEFVPTVEFSFAFTPAADEVDGGWYAAANRLDWLEGDLCAEDARLVEATTGRLVVRLRQLRTVRRAASAHPAQTADPAAPAAASVPTGPPNGGPAPAHEGVTT